MFVDVMDSKFVIVQMFLAFARGSAYQSIPQIATCLFNVYNECHQIRKCENLEDYSIKTAI